MVILQVMVSSILSIVLMDGLIDRPFAPKSKSIPWGEIVTAVGSIGAGAAGAIGNTNANARGERLAHYQMNWQAEESQKARDYATQMWNAENAYNTPLNQRRLAEEAGYNPYLLGNENLGSGAGSAGNPGMQGAPNSVDFKSVNPLSGLPGAFDAVSRLMQIKQNQEQVDANKEEQHSRSLKMLFDLQMQALKEGGPEMAKRVNTEFADVFKNLDYENSFPS